MRCLAFPVPRSPFPALYCSPFHNKARLRDLGGRMSQVNEDNLIWIDLEMTGLDTDNDSILEIATIVTDKDLAILAEGPVFAIRHALERLEAMDAWNRNQHRKSGLWEQVLASSDDHGVAEQATIDFLKAWVPAGKSP